MLGLGDAGSAAVSIRGSGVSDSKRKRGRISMDLSELGRQLGQDLGGNIDVIVDRSVLYMRFPFLTRSRPGLKPWLRVDLQQVGKQQGVDVAQLAQLGQSTDPTQALDYLRGGGEFARNGTATVRGVAATAYTGRVDLQKLAGEATGAQRRSLEQTIEATGVKTIPTDVWIGSDGLVRRMRFRYAKIPGALSAAMTMTMEFYDFGTRVDVQPPPAEEVTDLAKLTKGS